MDKTAELKSSKPESLVESMDSPTAKQFESINPPSEKKTDESEHVDKQEDDKKAETLENEKLKQLAKLDDMMSSTWAFETEVAMIKGMKNFGFRFKSDLKVTLADLVEPMPELNYDEMKTLVQNSATFDELNETVFKQIKLGFDSKKVIQCAFGTEKLVKLVTEKFLSAFKISIDAANKEFGENLQTVLMDPIILRKHIEQDQQKSHYQKILQRESIIYLDWIYNPSKAKHIMQFIIGWFCNFAQDFNETYRYSIEIDNVDIEKFTARIRLDIIQA